jgi:spermidine/putrescine transport system substrate-binding protein
MPDPRGRPWLSRRGFVQGASLSALALGGTGLLSACGTSGAKVDQDECRSIDKSDQEKELSFSNWPLYIDPIKAKNTSTLEAFEQQTGITVDYATDVNDNEQFYAKVAPQLADCKSTGRDAFALTDWMAAKMIGLGWIQELDRGNMPNVDANLLDWFKTPAWDPDRKYSVPWQAGMTGICYNSELVAPVESFEDLLRRPDLKGKVTVLSEMRDTMIFLLLLQGADPEDFSSEEYSAAIDDLESAVNSGQIRRFTGNDYIDDLKSGNVVACESWSGDVSQLGNDKFKWIKPTEGFAVWADNMMVPNLAEHKTNVEELIDYYYDPRVAAQLAAWNYYVCPVRGAAEFMAEFDKSAVANPLIFPDEAELDAGIDFMVLDSGQEKEYQKMFNEVQSG